MGIALRGRSGGQSLCPQDHSFCHCHFPAAHTTFKRICTQCSILSHTRTRTHTHLLPNHLHSLFIHPFIPPPFHSLHHLSHPSLSAHLPFSSALICPPGSLLSTGICLGISLWKLYSISPRSLSTHNYHGQSCRTVVDSAGTSILMTLLSARPDSGGTGLGPTL